MQLAQTIRQGDKRALAKGITLLESEREDQAKEANELLEALLPYTGKSQRVAVSGPPGVGKSTLIESLGLEFCRNGKKIAVLAIDPSSPKSGGSILGDRLRMEQLARQDQVFIRPTAAGETLGGTGKRTREAILACEAAGFDTIFVETVGVGQSEALAATMVDVFLMLHLPNSGDELQGIKRGILELADLVVVTKSDSGNEQAAQLAKAQLEQALQLGRDAHKIPQRVMAISSLNQKGISDLAKAIAAFLGEQKRTGAFTERRSEQASAWFQSEVQTQLQNLLKRSPTLADLAKKLDLAVRKGGQSPRTAAQQIISALQFNPKP